MVFLIVFVASLLLQIVLPWWIIVPISFISCALLGKTGKIALWSPFFAILLLWTAVALFKSLPNQNILVTRVAEMLGLQGWWLLLLLTGILGGFVAGVSGFCGYHFRKALLVKKAHV
jgi:hypothetical protein